MKKALVLDSFCLRQFNPSSSTYIPYDPAQFLTQVQAGYSPSCLVDGYADFCKHIFVPNFTDAPVLALEITNENQHLLKTGYEARTEKELPVLVRYFEKEAFGPLPKAKYLDVILYSFEQIQKEKAAMGDVEDQGEYDWGIISVKPQDEEFESPMQPITMMRNALGKEEGGSGVGLNREKYLKSVEYWSKHALVK
jgi:hypothetical protein